MKPSKLLGTSILTMLALTASIVASAQAATLPNILPEGTTGRAVSGTSSSGASKFGNGILTITSRKSKGTLESEQTKLGHFDVLFEESTTAEGEKCTGLDDSTTGSILALGTYHIRDHNPSPPLTVIIFLLKPVHFWCEGTTITQSLILWTGCVAGTLTPESRLTKTLVANLAKTGSDNNIITVLNEENTGSELCQLLAEQNGGAAKLASEVTEQVLTGFEQGGRAVEVLVMPL